MAKSECGYHVYTFTDIGISRMVVAPSNGSFPLGCGLKDQQWSDSYRHSPVVLSGGRFSVGLISKAGKQTIEYLNQDRQGNIVVLWDMSNVCGSRGLQKETVMRFPDSDTMKVESHYVDADSDRIWVEDEIQAQLEMEGPSVEVHAEALVSNQDRLQLFFEAAAAIQVFMNRKSNTKDLSPMLLQMHAVLCQLV